MKAFTRIKKNDIIQVREFKYLETSVLFFQAYRLFSNNFLLKIKK